MALMDDRNGTEHADWLMRGRMAFCRAYPGQIALIILGPTKRKNCGHLFRARRAAKSWKARCFALPLA